MSSGKFDRWSDSQRKAVLQDFVLSCSVEQLSFLSLSVSRRLPLQAADFTCLLPRAISLYIFSFLDPRSLCRCAQVSWHWKSIVELDQLWMPKCLRFGWCINFSPTPFEQAVWKRQYIQTVQELRPTPPQAVLSQHSFMDPVVTQTSSKNEEASELASLSEERSASTNRQFGSSSRMGKRNEKQPCSPIPWRDSDRHPKDTIRFNYLDNLDPTEQALAVQMKGRATTSCTDTLKPDGRSKKTLSEANYKLRKAKSLMFLSSSSKPHHSSLPPHHPPHQAQTQTQCGSHSDDYAAKSLLRQAQWNAGIRPGPVRSAVPRLSVEALRASQRSHRSVPSTPLFEGQPWTVPASHTQ
ncbi:F-box only protein 16 isoform X2 [Mastacembelus armatus]|uniref:F-box only protein 16 isoform X2 n=1 Tax=Mastacembelus armatus TaxID=205130 RepID=UPI000E4612AB|nr:F-box only protein 16 isoform X2 [Mastacembelus armatus]